MAQATKIFSKLLTETDIKKGLAIPAKILPALPDFNGSHAVKFQLMYGTRMWPIVCSVRKGYKKPVFSGGWRNFVICNGFKDKVGYELTLYKVQDEESGTFYYTIEVEKPADGPSVAFSPRDLSLQNHEVGESDETPAARRIQVGKYCEHEEKEQVAKVDAPQIKEEEDTMKIEELAADGQVPLVDYVVVKTPMSMFVTYASDDIGHFKTEQTEMKLCGTPKGMGNDETQLPHACYMTKEQSDIKTFDFTEGGSMLASYGTTEAAGEK